ncbi:MAG: DPP IV N-terminal domain-containing protein, partial [Saprospiraceae bacterium]|nr:DPP IV N-terminal domain-containing protein [Saprospiraceae bacterium]
MKKLFAFGILFTVYFSLTAQKTIALEDCFMFYKFYPQSGAELVFLKDGKHYVEIDQKGLHIRDLRDEKIDSVVTLNLPKHAQQFDQFELSDDETKLLLRTETEPIYRHSVLANYFVYDLKTQSTTAVCESEKQQFVTLSPDGKSAAYVANNNLYIKDLVQNRTIQITRDGAKNKIINGLPDWVYEEEFSPVDGNGMVATKWSPNSKYLAFIRFDETEVPEFKMTFYENAMYPRLSSFKYPKVGEKNSIVSVHLYNADSDDVEGEIMGLETTDYVPRIHFSTDNKLIVSRLNRRQDTLELLMALPERAIFDRDENKSYIPSRLVLQETDPAYVELEWESKLTFLKNDPNHFLYVNEKSGFTHIWYYPINPGPGETPKPLTSGSFDVTSFYGVNEKTGKFYFQAATPTPLDRQIWEGD